MNPIILALDMPNLNEARAILDKTRDYIGMIKIGPELWASHASESFLLSKEYNIPMFLDLKFHDIPNTVSSTISNILSKVDAYQQLAFLTVHVLGGKEMLKAALDAVAGSNTEIVAVTLLTSLNREDTYSLGIKGMPGSVTTSFAHLAKHCGIRNFVCGAQNIDVMRANIDNDKTGFKSVLFCPGIRSASAPEDDQKRTKPVSFAIKSGADWIVVGRPITKHPDPAGAVKDILAQVEKARI